MRQFVRAFGFIVFILMVAMVVPLWGQNADKRPLSHDDYDAWKSIVGSKISMDGNWVCYLETPQDGDAELVVLNLKSSKVFRHTIGYSGEGTDSERAARPQFSANSVHLVFLISPSQEEVKAAKKEKKKDDDKPKKKLGVMDLSDGSVTEIERVKSFKVPEKAGAWVAYLMEEPPKSDKKDEEKEEEEEAKEEEKEEKKEEEDEDEKEKEKKKKYGTRLVLQSLQNATKTEFESVMEYLFTEDGKHFLYIVSSKEQPETDGIYYRVPGEEASTPLLTGEGNYSKWVLNKEETVLGFVTDRDDYEADEPTFSLYGWKVGDTEVTLWVTHASTTGFPDGMAVSDKSDISFSDDGKVVMFGIKEIPEPKKEEDEEDDEEKAKFELWHWNDPYPQPQQKIMAKQVRDNTWESVYHIKSKKFVKLADETLPDLSLNRTGTIAFGQTNWPHSKAVSYFGRFNDVYVVNSKTGEKNLVKEHLFGNGVARLSPMGKYVIYFEGTDWFVYNVKTRVTVCMTEDLEARFDREDHDRPEPPSSYGMVGWTKEDKSVLIYDRYDIWEITPDGQTRRLITEGYGRQNDLSFRYIRLDPEEVNIDPKMPMLLQATDQNTMDMGFYQDRVNGITKPIKILWAEKYFSRPQKAENSDKLLFSRSTFNEYPDLWVSDLDFSNPRKITTLGNQMNPFIWGKAEMRDFFSSDGKPLKGILIKPENFDSSKKYPLMVYIYETLHTGRHRYRNPSPGSSVNPPYYVSNGYVMWMPDIEYDTGYPGKDALKCVLPGIQMLIREGYIDPEAIGIQGHSWGGYQISYMITQTNIFAACEAGAPVSNMTSAYGGIRWGSGMVRQFQYEQTQSRLGASLWEVPMRYIENSPIFWADKVQTPIMYMHNDEDGAVPWYQGIEYIMALRRLEREAYMFNYNGEAHGLRKRVNQEDFTIRMAEFFDHHLKGTPPPKWMTDGIKAWEKEEEEEEN